MFCLWSHSSISQFAASVPLHRPRVLSMQNTSTLALRALPLGAWSDLFVAVTQRIVMTLGGTTRLFFFFFSIKETEPNVCSSLI